jgi:hypothetical protein
MLGRIDEDVLVLAFGILPIVGIFTLAAMWLRRGEKDEKARLDLLREALRHPGIDELTRAQLVRALAADDGRPRLSMLLKSGKLLTVARHALFVIGWPLLLIGGAGWVMTEMRGGTWYSTEPWFFSAITGLALVSLPLALRELDGRTARGPATPHG